MYLGLSILDINKIVKYEYQYDCAKPKYEDIANLQYTDRYNFIVHVKSKGVYADFAENVDERFDTSNYQLK